MDTHKAVKMQRRPSRVLGLCLLAFFVFVVGVMAWQFNGPNPYFYRKFTASMWVGFLSASVAVMTWGGTSYLTLRNSLKQHTITTLLQMRLSATYMGYADTVSKHFVDYDQRHKKDLRLPEVEKPVDNLDLNALRYILNYFEFLAIGVSRGDFDDDMLRSSLRSILRKNVEMSRSYIRESQEGNPRLYEHLAWLHDEWCPEKQRLSLTAEEREKFAPK